ncbi:hypothetical protein BU25DRAFT_149421 [Macroventuria anomochaeta]|uniref:Uncharacterized protein n=1 Tax=Macroventuria anomochaeta TaxID=301207 RepID=A0ACB6SED6_9PLEO|nr:uncharacterized protein BU25DRAFT_149421 [Macroventuria anomochaeta]KAF2632323.1 hypothetical protein BU25DRAFT_149421 [Macroventuria anomochaeta]
MKGIRSTETDNQPNGPVPKLISRVTVQAAGDNNPNDDYEEDKGDFVTDDTQYVANKKQIDWKQYDKCKRWLREVEGDK